MPAMTVPSNIKLFSRAQVCVATLLGAPVAGAILMGKNYKSLGQTKAAGQTLAVGLIGTGILIVAAFLLPAKFPNSVLPIASVVAVYQWYKQAQEDQVNSHFSAGGEKGSWWLAVGIGVLCLAVIMAIIFAAVLVLPENVLT
jgi:hypothetical protein